MPQSGTTAGWRIGLFLSLVLAIVQTGGCKDGMEFPTSYAMLSGTVRTSSGPGVAGATIQVYTFASDCRDLSDAASFAYGNTNAVGDYLLQVASDSPPRQVCVAIRVLPPQASGLRDTTVTDLFVALKNRDTAVLDTLRVQIILQALP